MLDENDTCQAENLHDRNSSYNPRGILTQRKTTRLELKLRQNTLTRTKITIWSKN